MMASLSAAAIEQASDGYYLIASADDWNDFAAIVQTTNDANARMTADVDLGDSQAKIGHPSELSQQYYFKGTFDGAGHTLTIHYTTDPANAAYLCSPFPNLSQATIKNLHIDGTITSTVATQPAVIGRTSYGVSTIDQVWSSVTVTSTKSGWCESSGLVGCVDGYKGGRVVVTDCLVSGSVKSAGSYEGCFIGYVNSGGSATVTNSLSVANFEYSGTSGFPGTYTNCFVKQFPTAIPSAMQMTDEQLADGTIAVALQADREQEVWLQDEASGMPMLKIFLGSSGSTSVTDLAVTRQASGKRYNLMGQPVTGDYHGIVIEDGKKLIVK